MGGRGNFSGGTTYVKGSSIRGTTGKPNSKTVRYQDGKKVQERYYDSDGHAKYDIDYSHGGNGKHKFPHKHDWDWSDPQNPKRSDYEN